MQHGPCYAKLLSTSSPPIAVVKPASADGAKRPPGTTITCSGSSPARFMREPWGLCGLRATPSFKRGDDHVGVHYVAESVVERGQRGVVFGLAVGGVAVADHDRAKIQHAGIASGTLTAHIGHRAPDSAQ